MSYRVKLTHKVACSTWMAPINLIKCIDPLNGVFETWKCGFSSPPPLSLSNKVFIHIPPFFLFERSMSFEQYGSDKHTHKLTPPKRSCCVELQFRDSILSVRFTNWIIRLCRYPEGRLFNKVLVLYFWFRREWNLSRRMKSQCDATWHVLAGSDSNVDQVDNFHS